MSVFDGARPQQNHRAFPGRGKEVGSVVSKQIQSGLVMSPQELTQANEELVLRLDGLREEFTRIHTKL